MDIRAALRRPVWGIVLGALAFLLGGPTFIGLGFGVGLLLDAARRRPPVDKGGQHAGAVANALGPGPRRSILGWAHALHLVYSVSSLLALWWATPLPWQIEQLDLRFLPFAPSSHLLAELAANLPGRGATAGAVLQHICLSGHLLILVAIMIAFHGGLRRPSETQAAFSRVAEFGRLAALWPVFGILMGAFAWIVLSSGLLSRSRPPGAYDLAMIPVVFTLLAALGSAYALVAGAWIGRRVEAPRP
ncbi:MAG TPA: hypothetical protein VGN83_14945 [Falsiroseomonas sp.]|jgi:hypothetical protein|nr:hypothetical protein [Falsiroseomonas sp.]